MLDALSRAAAFWFFVLGILAIAGALMLGRGALSPSMVSMLNVIDLPLLLAGMLFAGTSLYRSMVPAGRSSPTLLALIAVPLVGFFCLFAYFNFGLPFPEVL